MLLPGLDVGLSSRVRGTASRHLCRVDEFLWSLIEVELVLSVRQIVMVECVEIAIRRWPMLV